MVERLNLSQNTFEARRMAQLLLTNPIIQQVGLFGSTVHGKEYPNDIDLGIFVKPELARFYYKNYGEPLEVIHLDLKRRRRPDQRNMKQLNEYALGTELLSICSFINLCKQEVLTSFSLPIDYEYFEPSFTDTLLFPTNVANMSSEEQSLMVGTIRREVALYALASMHMFNPETTLFEKKQIVNNDSFAYLQGFL